MTTETTQGFRLSPQQERIWSLRANHTTFYRSRCSVSLTGKLDTDRLERAVNDVVSRHEILRTSFSSLDPHTSLQIIHKDPTERLQVMPFDAESSQQRRALEQEMAALRDKPFDVSDRPPYHWRLWRMDETNHVL